MRLGTALALGHARLHDQAVLRGHVLDDGDHGEARRRAPGSRPPCDPRRSRSRPPSGRRARRATCSRGRRTPKDAVVLGPTGREGRQRVLRGGRQALGRLVLIDDRALGQLGSWGYRASSTVGNRRTRFCGPSVDEALRVHGERRRRGLARPLDDVGIHRQGRARYRLRLPELRVGRTGPSGSCFWSCIRHSSTASGRGGQPGM